MAKELEANLPNHLLFVYLLSVWLPQLHLQFLILFTMSHWYFLLFYLRYNYVKAVRARVLLVSFLYYKTFSFHSTLTFKREFNRKTLENIVYNT